MGVSGFRPAPQVDPDELDRRGTNISGLGRTRWESTLPFNVGPLRPSKGTHNDESETTPAEDDLQSVDADDFRMWWERGLAPTAAQGRWKLTLKGRALVGVVAIIGSVLALKGCAPSFDLFVDNGPALTQFPGDRTVDQSSDADTPSGKDGAQSAQGKIAKEQLDDLSTQASPAPLPGGRSGDVRSIQPTAGVSNATPVAQKGNTSAVASLSSQLSSAQSPDLRPARTASSMRGATIGVRPSSLKLDIPTKRPAKITNRVVIGKVETTAPSAAPDTRNQPLPIETPAKPEKPASSPNAAQPTANRSLQAASQSPAAGHRECVWRAGHARPTADRSDPYGLDRLGGPTGSVKIGGRSQERSQATRRKVCVCAQRIDNPTAQGPR